MLDILIYSCVCIHMLHVKKKKRGHEFEREQGKAYGRIWRGKGKGEMITILKKKNHFRLQCVLR